MWECTVQAVWQFGRRKTDACAVHVWDEYITCVKWFSLVPCCHGFPKCCVGFFCGFNEITLSSRQFCHNKSMGGDAVAIVTSPPSLLRVSVGHAGLSAPLVLLRDSISMPLENWSLSLSRTL